MIGTKIKFKALPGRVFEIKKAVCRGSCSERRGNRCGLWHENCTDAGAFPACEENRVIFIEVRHAK